MFCCVLFLLLKNYTVGVIELWNASDFFLKDYFMLNFSVSWFSGFLPPHTLILLFLGILSILVLFLSPTRDIPLFIFSNKIRPISLLLVPHFTMGWCNFELVEIVAICLKCLSRFCILHLTNHYIREPGSPEIEMKTSLFSHNVTCMFTGVLLFYVPFFNALQ